MQSPVKVPLTRNAAPTSGALAPLRARHTISSALPSLRAMATPEALVNAWARCAMTASSSGEAPRALLLAVLLAVSEAWVAILRRPLRCELFFYSSGLFARVFIRAFCPGVHPGPGPAFSRSSRRGVKQLQSRAKISGRGKRSPRAKYLFKFSIADWRETGIRADAVCACGGRALAA